LGIKWRHSNERFSLAAFASLRLGENRRLNKEEHFSQRRKGAAIYFSKTINAGATILHTFKGLLARFRSLKINTRRTNQ